MPPLYFFTDHTFVKKNLITKANVQGDMTLILSLINYILSKYSVNIPIAQLLLIKLRVFLLLQYNKNRNHFSGKENAQLIYCLSCMVSWVSDLGPAISSSPLS